MKPKYHSKFSALFRVAALPLLFTGMSRADEIVIDPPGPAATDVIRAADQTIWFDSGNTGTAIQLSTINGVVPATGPLPGWAHTRWSYLKYDGANVVEIPNTEKIVGEALVGGATGTSIYYDNAVLTNLTTSKSIGLLETTRDFVITGGMTLDVTRGGVMFHNDSHWIKASTATASITSASHQLVAVANGGSADYQINSVVVKDFDATHPLQFIKTGADPLNLSANNTYTGGTLVLNGVLRGSAGGSFGTQTVKVQGNSSQLYPSGAATYANNIEITGTGPGSSGALRLGNAANLTGSVTVSGASRISAEGTESGTITGPLIGTEILDFNNSTGATTGTITLNGSAAGYTGEARVYQGRLNVNSVFGGNLEVWENAGIGGKGTLGGNLVVGGPASSPAATIFANGFLPGALAVSGTLNLFGPTQIMATGFPSTGTSFTALTYGTLDGDLANLTVAGLRGATLTHSTATKSFIVNFTPGDIVWTGVTNANWALTADTNFANTGGPTQFYSGDKVTFNDASTVQPIIVGTIYPGTVTFANNVDLVVTGTNAGIAGAAGIVKNGTGMVTLGGQLSTFTGPVAINQGILKLGNAQSLGNSSGIIVAAGGQVDINGSNSSTLAPPLNYTYTLAGNGPNGLGALTNSSAAAPNEGSGIRNIVLSADASIGGNAGRYDIGFTNATQGTITGNGHTLTKVGSVPMGFRGDAGASPIKFVIAAGTVWGENNDRAWGGTTGSLTIQSGAIAGTYGVLSIATPVSIESGGTLHNQGGGIGTWTGPVAVAGNVRIDANTGFAVILNGAVTGNAALTKTGANTVTIAQPGWTGDTTVSAGTLVLGQATLNDASAVRIDGATTVLSLNFAGQDQVRSLVIDGVAQPDGVYSLANLPAHIAGTGSLKVVAGAAAPGYSSWATANGINGIGASVDSDGDGIPNGIEYVIGGAPSGANSNSSALLPVVTTDPTYLVFTYRRSTLSNNGPAGEKPYVQYGSNLTSWTTATAGTGGVLIDVGATEVSPGVFPVTVKIPRTLGTGGKIFARLRTDIP